MNSTNGKLYIAYSNNESTRYTSTSGGIGSQIVQYLFENRLINSAIAFKFSSASLQYEPQIITRKEEYINSGSIYHEINLISFIKNNIGNIKSPFCCFCLPCQTKALRFILSQNNIDSMLIELTCSSQQSYEATEYLFKRLHLKKNDIKYFQYRGNGWPSGIQIQTKNSNIFVPNNGSIWTKIFHSQLFCMKRCFQCNPDIPSVADLTIADPWRICNIKDEKIGRTLCYAHTSKAIDLIVELKNKDLISYNEIPIEMYEYSQYGTYQRKRTAIGNKRTNHFKIRLFTNRFYRRIVLSSNISFYIHFLIKKIIDKIVIKIMK